MGQPFQLLLVEILAWLAHLAQIAPIYKKSMHGPDFGPETRPASMLRTTSLRTADTVAHAQRWEAWNLLVQLKAITTMTSTTNTCYFCSIAVTAL